MLWFLIIILSIVFGAQGYVSWRLWKLLPFPVAGKSAVIALLALALVCLIVNFTVSHDRLGFTLKAICYEVGNTWLVLLLYLFLLLGLMHIASATHMIPEKWSTANWASTASIALFMLALMVGANAKYRNKVRVPLTVESTKITKPMRIVMASDLHLGYHNRRDEFAKWVDMINGEFPDLVLIGGDIIDIAVEPLEDERVWEEWHRIKAPVVACLGNHEHFSGEPRARKFYAKAGIHLLIDESTQVAGINIVGRDDRTHAGRKSISQIMQQVDCSRYTIVLDHQPYHLERAQRAGADFQFSGHTHYGQVWPGNWVTKLIYELPWGHKRKGDTDFYVSSGLGIWGPKLRIGTQSEYVVLDLKPVHQVRAN